MATARLHNAILNRARIWTSLARSLNSDLSEALRGDASTTELLTGVRDTAIIELPHSHAAADLLVLLDHMNLHAGRQLFLAPLRQLRFAVTDRACDRAHSGPEVCALARQLTVAAVRDDAVDYAPWTGRIDQIAVITCDRPGTLALTLDAWSENLRIFRRKYVEIVVYDDSGLQDRAQVRSLVEARRARGDRIRYVGPEEKHQLRLEIKHALACQAQQPPMDVLDALLGRLDTNGRWHGSSAQQRNWATWLAPGSRVLVSDDDAMPAVLDVSLDTLRATARLAVPTVDCHVLSNALWPGRVLEDCLAIHPIDGELVTWPQDLLGRFEMAGAGLISAAYTGHPDRRSALWLERFFEITDESVDILEDGGPLRPVRRDPPAATPRKFRGGTYATSGSFNGVEFATRRDRNEDFALALSQSVTSRGTLQPREVAGAYMYHRRGRRRTGAFVAHRQEREGALVMHMIATANGKNPIARAGLEPRPPRDLGRELFTEGVAYCERALAHVDDLRALLRQITAAQPTPAEPTDMLVSRWYRDPLADRTKLLWTAARLIEIGVAPTVSMLRECVHVLVPEGIVENVDPSALRNELQELPPASRTKAVETLEREATYLLGALGHRRRPSTTAHDMHTRVRQKIEQSEQLVQEISAELGISPIVPAGPTQRDELATARAQFSQLVQKRIMADVQLFSRALPWAYSLRATLAVFVGQRRERPAGIMPNESSAGVHN